MFAPLTEIVERLSAEKRDQFERLYMVSDRRGGLVHPLLYAHPETGKRTMCFHLGMTEGFVTDNGVAGKERQLSDDEVEAVLASMHEEIMRARDDGLVYQHEWQPGDFIISDNLALGHEAAPETQLPRSEVGLRVMHRVTVKGKTPPKK